MTTADPEVTEEIIDSVIVVTHLVPTWATLLTQDGPGSESVVLKVNGRCYEDGEVKEQEINLAIQPAIAGYIGAVMAEMWTASCVTALAEMANGEPEPEPEPLRRTPSAYL